MGILDNKVIVITGGASGIGLATTKLFLSEGAHVHILDRESAGFTTVLTQLAGSAVTGHVADVTERDAVDAAIAAVVAVHGQIDVVICNAGISGEVAELVSYPAEVFQRVINVHVMGAFNTLQSTIPHVPDGASIIITSSITGLVGPPKVSAYATAKHAQVGMMKSLAAELAPRGIRVNTINPGPVDNSFQNDVETRVTGMDIDGANSVFNEMIPLGRHIAVDEVAQSMLFLAGPHSSSITSTTFRVDGGMAG
ncbi:MAG: SDR family oxidoreductase [Actinomycetales bacterium]|nr:SDR family oxidoreductase [Actinomycetales bacterium]